MTGMPAAAAFCATDLPRSLLIDAMTRTFTPWVIMPSAIWENLLVSPCAFWTSASSPSFFMAAVIMGLSKASHRAELAVSGRMTPTLVPEPELPAAAELGELPLLLAGGAAELAP